MPLKPIEWRTLEYKFQEKSADWFWALGIIAISIAAVSVLFHNILFAILILVASFALSLYANRKPNRVICRLSENDVRFGKNVYPYSNLESFWVEVRDNDPRIIIKSKKAMMPFIVIPTGIINPEAIKNFLSRYLLEEELLEPLSQKIMEFLGF